MCFDTHFLERAGFDMYIFYIIDYIRGDFISTTIFCFWELVDFSIFGRREFVPVVTRDEYVKNF